jgi:hypothetical protein
MPLHGPFTGWRKTEPDFILNLGVGDEMAPVLVGREPEVAAVAGFLGRATQNSPVMLVEGEIGIGKTSILAAARDAARERGWLVLTANPAELERPVE